MTERGKAPEGPGWAQRAGEILAQPLQTQQPACHLGIATGHFGDGDLQQLPAGPPQIGTRHSCP